MSRGEGPAHDAAHSRCSVSAVKGALSCTGLPTGDEERGPGEVAGGLWQDSDTPCVLHPVPLCGPPPAPVTSPGLLSCLPWADLPAPCPSPRTSPTLPAASASWGGRGKLAAVSPLPLTSGAGSLPARQPWPLGLDCCPLSPSLGKAALAPGWHSRPSLAQSLSCGRPGYGADG